MILATLPGAWWHFFSNSAKPILDLLQLKPDLPSRASAILATLPGACQYFFSLSQLSQFWNYSSLITSKKQFYFLFCFLVYFSITIINLKSVFFFFGLQINRDKNLHNPEKIKFSELSEVSGFGRRKWTLDLDSVGLKEPENSFSSIGKNPSIPKIQGG